MQVRPKELGKDILGHFDYTNWKKFEEEIKKTVKKYEDKSNYKKLDYSTLINLRKRPVEKVLGWCSRVVIPEKPIQHVVMLDYDAILYRIVEEELNWAIKEFNLSPFYVFKTWEQEDMGSGEINGNYTAISISKHNFGRIPDIMASLHCDTSFKSVPKYYIWKTWVLRLGKKFKKKPPEFKAIIGDSTKDYPQDCSRAHLTVLERLYPEIRGKVQYTNLDAGTAKSIYMSTYQTASK